MDRFHVIDDAAVILRSRGVYRQAKLYRRGADVYAGFGNGFVRLHTGGGTSAPNLSWDAIDTADMPTPVGDSFGRLTLPSIPTRQIKGNSNG